MSLQNIQIAVARKALGLAGKKGSEPDKKYRAILVQHFGVMSSTALRADEVARLLGIFKGMGWKQFSDEPSWSGDKAPLGKKISAMRYQGKLSWNYIHAIAKRMFGIDRVQFCELDQLRAIVAALAVQQSRNAKNAAKKAGGAA